MLILLNEIIIITFEIEFLIDKYLSVISPDSVTGAS